MHVFRKLDTFEYRGEGALLAYLRQPLMNRIRNEIRRTRSRPAAEPLDSAVEDRSRSPVDAARMAVGRALVRLAEEMAK